MLKIEEQPFFTSEWIQKRFKVGDTWSELFLEISHTKCSNGNNTIYTLDSPKGYVRMMPNWKKFFRTCTYKEFLDFENKAHFSLEFNSLEEVKELNPRHLFIWDRSNRLVFDLDGAIYVRPYYFDYVGTPFNSDVLDLEAAHKSLSNHPWCQEIGDIEKVPYYNQNEEDDLHVFDVVLRPDQRTYSQLWEKFSSDKKEKYPSVRLGEALHDGYCPTKERNFLGLLDFVVEEQELN